MNNYPLVSILVPIYNVEKYIERCARSIFEQTYPNLDIVFVDDCTPDDSIKILEKIVTCYPSRNGQVHIIHHEQNRGISSTRNTLVETSSGEFVMHVDSDDWLETNAVELLVRQQKETGADIVTGNAYAHYCDKVVVHANGGWDDTRETMLAGVLQFRLSPTLWRRIIRKSLYTENNIQVPDNVISGEDYCVFPLLVYYSKKVSGISEIVYHYEKRNTKATTSRLNHNCEIQLSSYNSRIVGSSFFFDKEPWLQKISASVGVKYIHILMRRNLFLNNREGYYLFLQLLKDTDSHLWKYVGYDNPYHRWIYNHYIIIWLYYQLRLSSKKLFNNIKNIR